MNWVQVTVFMLIVGLCIVAVPAHAADEEARVLILNGTDPYLPAYLVIDSAMRASLAKEEARRIVFFSEPLDAQRFRTDAFEPQLVELLSKKYSGFRIDVVVAISLPALEFFRRYGAQLWPNARLVFSGWPGEVFDPAGLPPDTTAIVATAPVGETIDLARRMQPNARRVLVVTGASDLDRRNEQHALQVLSTGTNQLPFELFVGLPLPELASRIAAEPPDTIVFYLAQFRDREGRPYTPREVLRTFSARSVAPVYGIIETYLGFGMAAGLAESYGDHGRLVGDRIREALAGKSPGPDQILFEVPNQCVADARALQHWSLDESKLPEGCDIRFADRPLWRQYLWQIIAVLALLVAQSALIAALLSQRYRRRTAEFESQKRYSEMAHMNRRVAMGELSASIAHELNQPLGAIHNNAGAAELLIKASPPKLQEVAEILADIKRDDQRASDIIARIRKMLRKTEFEVREMDLNETIEETIKMLLAEASAKGVSLKSDLEAGLGKVIADRVEVQQVILNLVLNAMDAVHDQPADRRVLTIRSMRINSKEAEVSVVDSGPGIPERSLTDIFDPFVTTKQGGMGLGLAISRTIVEAHGGQIRAENRPDGGAAIHFTLPFASTAHA